MNYKQLLKPESMAVIGVSLHNNRHPANIVYRKNRLRYPVKVFAVNPRGGDIQGERLYERPEDIPEKVDLAVIAVRADLVPDTMAQCISAGMGGAVIISGGFAEVGQRELQDRLVKMAREADFPFVGPNCLGIFSPGRVDTFFLPPERTVRPESVMWRWSARAVVCWWTKWLISRAKGWGCHWELVSATRPWWMRWRCLNI